MIYIFELICGVKPKLSQHKEYNIYVYERIHVIFIGIGTNMFIQHTHIYIYIHKIIQTEEQTVRWYNTEWSLFSLCSAGKESDMLMPRTEKKLFVKMWICVKALHSWWTWMPTRPYTLAAYLCCPFPACAPLFRYFLIVWPRPPRSGIGVTCWERL